MIKVNLECIAGGNLIPMELQDEIEPEKEWRIAYININNICGVFPATQGGTLIDLGRDSTWLVREDIEEVLSLIKKDKK